MRAKTRGPLIAKGTTLEPGVYALEVGCGIGSFTEMFVETGAKLVAVDISPDLLKQAETRGLPKHQVRFLVKRFEDCEMDGPFDAVIGSSVRHHLDLETPLLRMRDLLKPRGVISFAEPNMLPNLQVFMERKIRK